MAAKRTWTIQGVLWVSCVLFPLTVLAQSERIRTTDDGSFNATITGNEGTYELEVSTARFPYFNFGIPLNGTTKGDAIITVSAPRHVDVDISCFPRTEDSVQPFLDPTIQPWRSDHAHGDDFVFISQHHPRYNEGLTETPDGETVMVTCTVQNNEDQPVSVVVDIDLDYETIEMRQEDEEALEAIFTKCCQSEDSCEEWKEHRSNEGSEQSDLCHFHTNVCNSDGHLFRLSLENLNMECEFPYEEIAQFKQLKKLLLKGNKFTGNAGAVLDELSTLSELEHIDIPDSQLSGSLEGSEETETSGICILASGSLLYLNLEHNDITGELPACLLDSSSRVKTIDLAFNKITGELPSGSEFSEELEVLDLTGNQLTGEIPASYVEGDSLETLDLSWNEFTGSIPGEFGVSPSLNRLNLSHNALSGTFPERLTEASTLSMLDMSNNELTGELPVSIGSMTTLRWLYLGSNEFTGSLPSSLGNLSSLVHLHLNNNNLIGSIINVLPSSLLVLDLRDNQFTGAIPTSVIPAERRLIPSSVQLSNNNFSSFDDEWYRDGLQLWQLRSLHAANNNIEGKFPPTLAIAPLLYELDLSNNDLSGPLPSVDDVFDFLVTLNLSSNAFTGPFPRSWKQSRLFGKGDDTIVDLSFNQLTGPLPGFLYKIPIRGRFDTIVHLEGNVFDVECPLPARLYSIQGLACNPDYSASAPVAEISVADIEADLPRSGVDTPAKSPVEGGETSTDEASAGTTESTTLSSSNNETTGTAESQSVEDDSDKSNTVALSLSVVVIVGFALVVVAFFVIRSRLNSQNTVASGGVAEGGRGAVPLASRSTLEGSRASTAQRGSSGGDDINMFTGMRSSDQI